MTFPHLGDDPSATLPYFSRKKDAKQWAAKCCIDWLMTNSYMPTDGVNVEFPKPPKPAPVPTPKKRKIATSPTNNTEDGDTNTTIKNEGDEPTAKKVEALCRLMGFNIPQYRISPSSAVTPSTGGQNNVNGQQQQYFNGQADFGADSIKVPDNLGRVVDILGRKNARERVAEEVLVWLVAEEERRVKEADEMLAAVEV
jgi:hypothetical protein